MSEQEDLTPPAEDLSPPPDTADEALTVTPSQSSTGIRAGDQAQVLPEVPKEDASTAPTAPLAGAESPAVSGAVPTAGGTDTWRTWANSLLKELEDGLGKLEARLADAESAVTNLLTGSHTHPAEVTPLDPLATAVPAPPAASLPGYFAASTSEDVTPAP